MGIDVDIRYTQKLAHKQSTMDANWLICDKLATIKEKDQELNNEIFMYASKVLGSYNDYYATPMPIDALKAHIDKVEEKGANFISIDWHCDHREYEITGLTIERETKSEKERAIEDQRLINLSTKKIELKRLEGEIIRLKKEIGKN